MTEVTPEQIEAGAKAIYENFMGRFQDDRTYDPWDKRSRSFQETYLTDAKAALTAANAARPKVPADVGTDGEPVEHDFAWIRNAADDVEREGYPITSDIIRSCLIKLQAISARGAPDGWRETLEFYAEPENWKGVQQRWEGTYYAPTSCQNDAGHRARNVLAASTPSKKG